MDAKVFTEQEKELVSGVVDIILEHLLSSQEMELVPEFLPLSELRQDLRAGGDLGRVPPLAWNVLAGFIEDNTERLTELLQHACGPGSQFPNYIPEPEIQSGSFLSGVVSKLVAASTEYMEALQPDRTPAGWAGVNEGDWEKWRTLYNGPDEEKTASADSPFLALMRGIQWKFRAPSNTVVSSMSRSRARKLRPGTILRKPVR